MGNEHKEKTLRTIDPTWLWDRSKGYMSLPRNLKNNKIRNYNDIDNNVLKSQHHNFCTLPKRKNNKSLSKDHKHQDTDNSKVLVLREGDKEKSLSLPENSKINGKNLATWNGKSLNKDEVNKLKGYISDNNITTLCITFVRPIDYKNGLKPLFEDIVSQSPKIDKMCININSIAKDALTIEYLRKMLLCAIKSLHKSEGQYSKNIFIGSDNNNHINAVTFEKILKAISEVNKNTKLESKTHCLKLFVAADNGSKTLCSEYEKKYSQGMIFKVINYDPSNTNAEFKDIIEFSQLTYPSKPSIFKKFYNTTIRNIISNKSDSEEEDTNTSISTHDNQDDLQDNIALGDAQPTADDICLIAY